MNIFRLLGDSSHLVAIILLIVQILKRGTCTGVSGKSQVFYLIVFITRYSDLFIYYISVYVTTMKVIYILTTAFTIFLIYGKYRETYIRKFDMPYAELIFIPPAFVLAIFVNHEFSFIEVLWTFSVYFESVAIVPQLYMIRKLQNAEIFTVQYLVFLGLYRALYLVNWVWRYFMEGWFDIIAISAGIVQTVLYCDFFYVFCTRSSLGSLHGDADEKLLDVTNI